MNLLPTGFSEHFKCPHIFISTVGATTWASTVTGNPMPLSYVPHVFLDLTDEMNLFERLQNTVFHLAEIVLMNLFFYGKQQEIYQTDFPNGKNFMPFQDKLKHGVSLVSIMQSITVIFRYLLIIISYIPNRSYSIVISR